MIFGIFSVVAVGLLLVGEHPQLLQPFDGMTLK